MIPLFLEPFRGQVAQLKRETIKISATPLPETASLPLKQSKLLGQPYIPAGSIYPHSKDGLPMIMLAQINFTEVPQLDDYPAAGILQLFIPAHNWYDMKEYAILFHENSDVAGMKDLPFLTPELYEECPAHCGHELSFSKQAEYGEPADFRFEIDFDGKDYYDYHDSLTKEQQEEMDKLFTSAGHKIGGYAFFSQYDPRAEDDNRKNDVLLLQIDTDDNIMFGDAGVAKLCTPLPTVWIKKQEC